MGTGAAKKRKRGGSKEPFYFKRAVNPGQKKQGNRAGSSGARLEHDSLMDLVNLYNDAKKENPKLSVSAFHETQRLKAEIAGTADALPGRTSLYRALEKVERGEDLQPRGRSGLLTDAEMSELLKRLEEFEVKYCVMTNSVICQEAADIFLRRYGDLADVGDASPVWTEIQKGLRTIFEHNNFVYRTREKHLTIQKSSRGMEFFRARKYQPELVVDWFRLVLHSFALRMIQVAIASGNIVKGWVIKNGCVTREMSNEGTYTGSQPGPDVLEWRDGCFWVKPLDTKLVGPPASRLLVMDEKPILPDGPKVKNLSVSNLSSLCHGRTSQWTAVPWLCGDGTLASATLIQRDRKTIDSRFVKPLMDADFAYFATDNGLQSPQTFVQDLERVLAKIQCSVEDPVVFICDGHSSHLTREATAVMAKHGAIALCEPSNLSTILQVGDNGVNGPIGSLYKKGYSQEFIKSRFLQIGFNDGNRIGVLVKAVKESCTANRVMSAFRECGFSLNDDCLHLGRFLDPKTYEQGKPHRDKNGPAVNKENLKEMFSGVNLSKPWGSPIRVPERSFCADFQGPLKRRRLSGTGQSYTAYMLEKADGEQKKTP
jgi:hypothetical protein